MIYLAVEMQFANPSGTASDEDFDGFLDCVVEELDNLDYEADVTASLANKTAAFGVGVEAESFEDAAANFLVALRTALHAAECGTARWPEFKAQDHVVRELAAA